MRPRQEGEAEMSGKKQDARVRYTKMVIRQSLVELLRKKPVAKITVTEICELAGINRATFYAHYSDPTDLLHSLENDLIEGITVRAQPALTGENGDITGTLCGIVEYIRENAEICRVLLSDTGDTNFQNQVVHVMERRYLDFWRSARGGGEEDFAYVYTFIALGSVGVIRKWLDEGMAKPAAEIAGLIVRLSAAGLMTR